MTTRWPLPAARCSSPSTQFPFRAARVKAPGRGVGVQFGGQFRLQAARKSESVPLLCQPCDVLLCADKLRRASLPWTRFRDNGSLGVDGIRGRHGALRVMAPHPRLPTAEAKAVAGEVEESQESQALLCQLVVQHGIGLVCTVCSRDIPPLALGQILARAPQLIVRCEQTSSSPRSPRRPPRSEALTLPRLPVQHNGNDTPRGQPESLQCVSRSKDDHF